MFLVFGSTRLEPLDFWWSPLDAGMIAAYAVILVGGLLITARLGLLAVAATFWITLAAGLALLAASGHCMVARWAFAPVCGADYWRAVALSPELLVFMFFMITDPKTVPAGRRGRIVFGFAVAVVCTLLMAPQTTEFATKVALLAGLAIACAGRPVLDRLLPRLPQRPVLRGMAIRRLRRCARGGDPRRRSAGPRRPGRGRRARQRRRTRSTRPRSRRSPSIRTCSTGTTRSPGRGHATWC